MQKILVKMPCPCQVKCERHVGCVRLVIEGATLLCNMPGVTPSMYINERLFRVKNVSSTFNVVMEIIPVVGDD